MLTEQTPLRARRTSQGGELGVIIPIIAVMSLAVLATLAILGLETTRTKQAATILRGQTERICKNVARSAVVPAEAMATFSREINLLPSITPHTRITKATLVLPLPLDTRTRTNGLNDLFYDFSSTQKRTCNTANLISFDPLPFPLIAAPSLPFGQVAASLRCLNPAAAPTLDDCLLVHDICDRSQTPPLPNPAYPPSMWSDIQNAANTVGCELMAEVDNIFSFSSSPRQVSAKASWWTPVRTRPPYLSDFTLSPASISSFAGLSLGIATQMTTWPGDLAAAAGGGSVGDNRFNFSAYPNFLSVMNPRRSLPANQNPQRLNFGGNNFSSSTAMPYPPSFGVSPTIAIPPAPPLLSNPGSTYPNRASEEYLTACVNPLTMVRNIIASTIVELAARHGQLRNLTEITSINPRHTGDSAWDGVMNRPVEIVRFGEDLTNEAYQHPFVTAHIDGSVPVLGNGAARFLLPWQRADSSPRYYNTDPSDPKRLERDTFLAQQLRYCFHLWDSDLIRRPNLTVHDSLTLLPSEFRFMFSLQNPQGVGLGNDPVSYGTWDYGRPWGGGSGAVSRLLNGAEVVQSLGSTQLCPVTNDPDGVFNCKQDLSTLNPASDLAPDIKAFLDHALGDLSAYPSPGLFHPTNASNGESSSESALSPASPMYRASNAIPAPPRSVVVIITTKGLFDATGSSYHDDIEDRIEMLNVTDGRPVIIVFIPATGADSNTATNYCTALRRGVDCSSPLTGADSNRLFLLSPFSSEYGGTYTGATEGETFRNFWKDLLVDGDGSGAQDLYAPRIGQVIFSESIVGLGPKL